MEDTLLYTLLVVGISFALTMVALIDIIKKDFPTVKDKFVWHLVAIIPIIGWLIYFSLGAKKGKKKTYPS
ncbi:MAG: hypothetical protein CSA29_06140 [Desulfobacterales bacterium]|nr:MAG: hypothetical protein CSA29_06140 [Desulfobacterales bacterium]